MDGYVLIEVNTEGKMRVQHHDGAMKLEFYDFRLCDLDWDNDFVIGSIEEQLPKDMKDVLIMVQFSYQSVPCGCGDYWSVDYEDCIIVESYNVVKTDYKEFFRKMATEELKMISYEPEPDSEETKQYYQMVQLDWEEFYDEDFVPFKPKEENKFPFKLNKLKGE